MKFICIFREFYGNYNLKMDIKLLSFILLLICNINTQSSHLQSPKVQALQKQISKAAGMDYNNYKLYPFAITSKKVFSVTFQQQEEVKAEIKVNWIDINSSQLVFPTYEVDQYIKASVMDVNTKKIIQQRKFHFQTGLKFVGQKNHRYKIVLTNYGKHNKMLQLSLSQIQPSTWSLPSHNPTGTLSNITERVINQFQKLARKSQQDRYHQLPFQGNILALTLQRKIQSRWGNDNQKQSGKEKGNQVEAIWSSYVWAAFWEVSAIGLVVFLQVYFVKRLVSYQWAYL